LVLTGRHASLEAIGRLVYAVRCGAGEVEVFDFRGAVPNTGASTVCRLGETPVAAADTLRARLAGVRESAGARLAGRRETAATGLAGMRHPADARTPAGVAETA
jgi:hypothetical protein